MMSCGSTFSLKIQLLVRRGFPVLLDDYTQRSENKERADRREPEMARNVQTGYARGKTATEGSLSALRHFATPTLRRPLGVTLFGGCGLEGRGAGGLPYPLGV